MKLLRRISVAVAVLLVMVLGLVFKFQDWRYSPLPVNTALTIEIDSGESFSALAAKLHRLEAIEYPKIWSWLAQLQNLAAYIQPGEYRVSSVDTPQRLLERMTRGDVVRYQFRIQEGWVFAQAVRALGEAPKLTEDLHLLSADEIAALMGVSPGKLEGSLFPDTYSYTKDQSRSSLLREAHQLMVRKLQNSWQNRSELTEYQSAQELLTMASIIEKESGLRSELANIAQVFNNRLRLNMRLQTDPTIIYGLGDSFSGNLTRAHLRQDTPYNSYMHKGLPPTPISLPGRHALDAAANPSQGSLLYFVARGDGSSEFSTNLSDHNAAVRQYQLRK